MLVKHRTCLLMCALLMFVTGPSSVRAYEDVQDIPAEDEVSEAESYMGHGRPFSTYAEEDELEASATYRTPTKALPLASYPQFTDDWDFKDMKIAIDRQLRRYNSMKLTGTIRMGAKTYKLTKAKDSLIAFRALIEEFERCAAREATKDRCYTDFNAQIRAKYDVYVPDLKRGDPRWDKENNTFFTGYHTHAIEGKLTPDPKFKHAIFANPKKSSLNKARVLIDFENALGGRRLEQIYSNFLFDIYLMHVAGSGRVTINNPDGSKDQFYLHYDGTNRQRWQFIGPYMARKGYITNGSIPSQRKFMRENPQREREIYSICPSYVYLRASEEPPRGSGNVPVTDGRTIATDNKHYRFKGLLTFVQTNRPIENGNYNLEEENRVNVQFQPYQRFYLDQDTGGAIEGKARVDIYFGASDYAYYSAMHMEQTGKLYYMMLK